MTGNSENQVDRTLWVGNLDTNRVNEELLYELFVQAGPLIDVKIAKDKDGNRRNYAFIEFKHDVSIPYTIQLMNGIRLFNRPLNLQCRPGSKHLSTASPGGQSSPMYTPEGRNSRPTTPNSHVAAPMEDMHFHRSHSMPANLSTFADQRGHQSHMSAQFQGTQRQATTSQYGHGHRYRQFQESPSGWQQQPGKPIPMTPAQIMAMNQQRYRPPNVHHQPWQPSGHRGHYGYR
ncbi:RNA-binding protein 7-like [Glandiceps talaboti]